MTVVAAVVSLVTFGWKIRNIDDAYSIKRELKFLARSLILFVGLHITKIALGDDITTHTAAIVVELLLWSMTCLWWPAILTGYPLWLSYAPSGHRRSRHVRVLSGSVSVLSSDQRSTSVPLEDVLTDEEYKVCLPMVLELFDTKAFCMFARHFS